MIHRKYELLVIENETAAGVKPKKMEANWMDFLQPARSKPPFILPSALP
nr:hypothetical protein [Candidatus Sigynarchaeum springense]